jgi:hypothetical protein
MRANGYIPVPRWDGKEWRPLDYRQPSSAANPLGHPEMPWPIGFDPSTIPTPKANLQDGVRFHWDGGIRHGEVHGIKISGGTYTARELEMKGSEAAVAAQRYVASCIYYDVWWNGHLRWVREDNLVTD